MSEALSIILNTAFVFSIIRITTPILFATLGACIADRAGMTNIGLDGMMTAAALAGVLSSAATGSALVGVLCAAAVGAALGLALGLVSVRLKVNLLLAGIAMNLICASGSALVLYLAVGDRTASTSVKSGVVPDIVLPGIAKIPVLGPVLSGHSVLTWLAFLLVIAASFFLNRTVTGLRIRSIGENEAAARSAGIRTEKYKYLALALSGVMAGFGGAFLSMSYVSLFTTGITAGRGFIAVAASAMSGGDPVGGMWASLLFGAANALANAIPTGAYGQDFIQMIPYIATVFGLTLQAAAAGRRRRAAQKYERQEVSPQ
jgi:ABC-type uncharacterized transport system permease subunit